MSEPLPTPAAANPALSPIPQSEIQKPQSQFSPEDHTLFEAFLRHGLSRDHLSKATNNPNLTTLEILAWLDQPHIAQARAAVRRFANESAAITLALSQVQAINTLARLTTTSPDPTQQRLAATTLLRAAQPGAPKRQSAPPQAEGLNGRNRGWSDRQRRSSDTPGPTPPLTPYPEGVPGAPITSSTTVAHNSDSMDSSEPHPLQSHSPSAPSASSATSAFSSKPTDLQNAPDQALESLIQTLDQAIDDIDLEDDETLTPQDEEQDEAEGERAYQFFMGLGVPLSHPDIINAIAEGRGNDLESIAARIRAESPRAP